MEVTEDDLVWFPQGQRLVVGSYLSLILEWSEECEVTSHKTFPRFSVSFMCLPQTQMQVCDLLLSSITRVNFPSGWLCCCFSDIQLQRREGEVGSCLFQRKKAQFQVHLRIPFHPTRGGSLKVIFSSSVGLGFALVKYKLSLLVPYIP